MANTFVSFDGIDGAGKTTLIREVNDLLRRSRNVYSSYAPSWRDDTKRRSEVENLHPWKQIFEYIQDFKFLQEKFAALPDNTVILQDRWADSTYVYQNIPLNDVESPYLNGVDYPDITFYLQCFPITAFDRLTAKGETPDLDELKDLSNKYSTYFAKESVSKYRWLVTIPWHFSLPEQIDLVIYYLKVYETRKLSAKRVVSNYSALE